MCSGHRRLHHLPRHHRRHRLPRRRLLAARSPFTTSAGWAPAARGSATAPPTRTPSPRTAGRLSRPTHSATRRLAKCPTAAKTRVMRRAAGARRRPPASTAGAAAARAAAPTALTATRVWASEFLEIARSIARAYNTVPRASTTPWARDWRTLAHSNSVTDLYWSALGPTRPPLAKSRGTTGAGRRVRPPRGAPVL